MANEDNKILKCELLPLGVRAGLITVPQTQNTTYLLKIFEKSEKSSTNEYQILMDSGSKRVKDPELVDPQKLKVVLLSHAHLDHTIYLGSLLRMLKKQKRKEKLLVICHKNGWKPLKWWIRLFCGSIPKFIQYIPIDLQIKETHLKEQDVECETDLTQITSITPIPIGESLTLEITIAPALHSVSSVVYRLKLYSKESPNTYLDFMFSPDTSYTSEHLIPFAKNAKYWILDGGFLKEEIDKRFQKLMNHEKKGEIVCHSGPYYSGKICEAANVDTYLVGHYVWNRIGNTFEEAEKEIIRRVKQTYNGNVVVTKDLKTIKLEMTEN